MIPDWMKEKTEYIPPNGNNNYLLKTIYNISKIINCFKLDKGHEKDKALPPILKFLFLIVFILILSFSKNKIIILIYFTVVLIYLAAWPAKDILEILKMSIMIAIVTLIVVAPIFIAYPENRLNCIYLVLKAFLSMSMVGIFNHTTRWNHFMYSLKKIHVPTIVIFTLDNTMRFIINLGELMKDTITALFLRSVGKNNKKYNSIGGVMGTMFIKGSEMNLEIYEAMICRGFTDDYKHM